MRAIALICLSLVLLGCGGLPNNNPGNHPTAYGPGQLYKLSGQSFTSSKKVLFIHGRFMSDTTSNGQSQTAVERLFASKIDQLDYVCKQQLAAPLKDNAEIWFYTYNTHQDVGKIADDLASAIKSHPNFRESEICIVGYSEGGVVTWLLDQRYQLIKGGVLLGAPILGSPLANSTLTKTAAKQIWPNLSDTILQPFINWLLGGSDNLVAGYPESALAKSELMMFSGKIDLPSGGAVIQLADAIIECVDSTKYGQGVQASNRQVAQCGALLINAIDWRDNSSLDKQSDGIVPVSSASCGSSNVRVWADYDHYDLLSGKDDLVLDQATFDWIDHVLRLKSEFASGGSLPTLPEITLNVPTVNLLAKTKFAYIKDGQLVLTDSNFATQTSIAGNNVYPRFSADGLNLVWTQQSSGNYGIYLLNSGGITAVTNGWYGSLSPDGNQLIFQRDDKLIIRDLSTGAEATVVSGVQLTSPPVWWKSPLASRIYFVHKDGSTHTNLYWVDSKNRDVAMSSANLVASNCDVIFPFHGYISGVAAAAVSGQTSKLWLVAGLLGDDLSLEFQADAEQPEFVVKGTDQTFKLDQDCQFDAAVTDWETGLYLTGSLNGQIGIYYLDIVPLTATAMGWRDMLSAKPTTTPQIAISDVLKLAVPDGVQLDIKPAPN